MEDYLGEAERRAMLTPEARALEDKGAWKNGVVAVAIWVGLLAIWTLTCMVLMKTNNAAYQVLFALFGTE